MKISLVNRQRAVPLDRAELRRLVRFFMEKARAMRTDRTWVACSVVFVGHEEMIDLNQRMLHHEGTTDVITFAYPTLPGEEPVGWRGELIVNTEEARDASTRLRLPLHREIALYIAHGCQHLGGADDNTPARRAAMTRRQNQWLREAEKGSVRTC